jgi:hypothetical protein
MQLQVTPLSAGSLDTVATRFAVWLVNIVGGGPLLKVTEIGGTTLTIALALLVSSVTEVAVMVTLPLDGTVVGAV